MPQRIYEEIGILAAIETEFHLRKVSREMFCTDLMPRSYDAALEQREGGFDGESQVSKGARPGAVRPVRKRNATFLLASSR
jgi:hypothetical protein